MIEPKEECFHLGAKALLHDGQGKLLLLQLHPKKCKRDGVCWDIPGGRIQRGESLEDALRREVREETTLEKISKITPLAMALSRIRISTPAGEVGLIFAVHLCELEGSNSVQLSDEHVDFTWVEPTQAAELLKPSYPHEITDKIAALTFLCASGQSQQQGEPLPR